MLIAEEKNCAAMSDEKKLLATPFYLIDEARLLKNLKKIETLKNISGAKMVLALKCFSTWSAFPIMRPYLDGTTSSSLFEARLGAEKFGGEVHAYSVAFSEEEIKAVKKFATKIIFNSLSQLERFSTDAAVPVGLRVNPGVSHSHFDLADPARKHSRLGESDVDKIMKISSRLSGAMFHVNCENDDFDSFKKILNHIAKNFEPLLHKLNWVSLGGGLYFTKDGYPLEQFGQTLRDFSKRFNVQVYLEPGEAAITGAGFLVTKVLDVVHNEIDIAVVDAAVEPHMLDLLIYRTPAKMENEPAEGVPVMVAGRTCLAGDIFGTYKFAKKPAVGDVITFADAAGYTMVKKNWFNGIPMPGIAIRRLNGQIDQITNFSYEDYVSSLS